MITIQFTEDDIHFSKIFYLDDSEDEKRIRVPLGKNKDIYLIIKREGASK